MYIVCALKRRISYYQVLAKQKYGNFDLVSKSYKSLCLLLLIYTQTLDTFIPKLWNFHLWPLFLYLNSFFSGAHSGPLAKHHYRGVGTWDIIKLRNPEAVGAISALQAEFKKSGFRSVAQHWLGPVAVNSLIGSVMFTVYGTCLEWYEEIKVVLLSITGKGAVIV